MSPALLVIDDDATLNKLLVRQLKLAGYDATGVGSWQESQTFLADREPDLIIFDYRLPDADGNDVIGKLARDYPVVVLTAYGSVKDAVRAMQAGVADYLVKPVNLDELELVVRRTLDAASLRKDYQYYKNRLKPPSRTFMVGKSVALQQVAALAEAVAPSAMTVLIQGESGVGKELVAQEIHQRSPRAERNFVAIDCCSLQENLFESELFGHERGAFTGADRQKKGLIESADQGTLFLDEIGEISPSIQAKLLRFLETGHFRRLGGTKDLTVDARIVAATNRSLEEMVKEGLFRADLFYRLNAFAILVPPLRERREDIPDLVKHFIRNHDFSRRINKTVSAEAMRQILDYRWPGNVRELKNIIERAIILSNDQHDIRPEHLALAKSAAAFNANDQLGFEQEPTLEDIERRYLGFMLAKYKGHRGRVAAVLGISERNVYRLIKRYHLSTENH